MATDYYVDGAVGNDANAGTSEGAGNALATIPAGFLKLLAASDRLYIKSSATYTNQYAPTSAYTPAAATPMIVEGYTFTPGDGGQITMNNAAAVSYGIRLLKSHYILRNIKVTNYNSIGIYANVTNSRMENCTAENCVSRGLYGGYGAVFIDCTVSGSTYAQFQMNQYSTVINCSSIGTSGTYGIKMSNYCQVMNTIMAGTPSHSLLYTLHHTLVKNCVFDGYGTALRGLYHGTNYGPAIVINNIFHDCNKAIEAAASYPHMQIGYGNVMNSNTANYTNWAATGNDIIADPLFNNEGAGDYSLAAGSPAIGAGFIDRGGEERTDSGAYQTALPVAGTSRVILAS